MNASAHLTSGTVVAMASMYTSRTLAGRNALAAGIGLLSHILLDSIPHSDYVFMPRRYFLAVSVVESMIVASIIAATLRTRLTPGWRWPLVVGVIAAGLPDMKVLVSPVLSPERSALVQHYGDRFHSYFHASPPPTPYIGLAIEVAFTISLLLLLTRFPRTATSETDHPYDAH